MLWNPGKGNYKDLMPVKIMMLQLSNRLCKVLQDQQQSVSVSSLSNHRNSRISNLKGIELAIHFGQPCSGTLAYHSTDKDSHLDFTIGVNWVSIVADLASATH